MPPSSDQTIVTGTKPYSAWHDRLMPFGEKYSTKYRFRSRLMVGFAANANPSELSAATDYVFQWIFWEQKTRFSKRRLVLI